MQTDPEEKLSISRQIIGQILQSADGSVEMKTLLKSVV